MMPSFCWGRRSAQVNTLVAVCVIAMSLLTFNYFNVLTSVNRKSAILLTNNKNPQETFFVFRWQHINISYNNDYDQNDDHNKRIDEEKITKKNNMDVVPVKTVQSTGLHHDYEYKSFRELLKLRYDEMPAKLGEDNRQEKDKYFIYRCDGFKMQVCGGWSDRIKGFLVGYIIANLTGRTFKAEIKTKGCDLHDYIVPNLVTWSLPVSLHQPVVNSDDVYLMNEVNSRHFFNTIQNINFITHPMNQHKYVYFKANLDYSDGLKASVFHHDQLSWMEGLTRDQIQGAIYRRLIKLSPRLQERLDKFLTKNLPNASDKLICAHVRLGRNPTIQHDTVVYNTVDVLPKVWDFIGTFSKDENNKIFLMSDSEFVMQEGRRQPFGGNLLEIPGKIAHVEQSVGLTTEDICKAQDKLVLEHFLLMHCDVLMISKSGLSRLPAYIRGSNEGLFCLIKGEVIPCRLETLKELYKIMG